jgi:hypothetical protein
VPTDTATLIKLVLLSLADGRTEDISVGWYLAAYDPEANDGNGMASWTPDPYKALTFATGIEAAACYRAVPRSRPVRPDGKPNRPLTMFALAFE